MSQCLVTGATGFVGRHLVASLQQQGIAVRCAVRDVVAARALLGDEVELAQIGELGGNTVWGRALEGIDKVIHLAGRAHVLSERAEDALPVFLGVNTDGTRQLARSAAIVGARRFVFVSSVKVNGESSGDRAYTADSPPMPADPYGESKLRAEQIVREIAQESGMETVIVRPPLVYGPGVGANFLRMLRLVDSGLPLPLGAVSNRRSIVSIWNLCDLLTRCALAPEARDNSFMVSDGRDLSTPELLRELARALDRPARLINVPVPMLRVAAKATGQMAQFTRLCASLAVDMSETTRILGWQPPLTVEESLKKTADWYRTTK